MNEELDNDLKRRISEVFDNYEDPTADEGWMMLREKFPAAAKHRGTAWLWWASAAAMFLLFLGVGMWLKTNRTETQPQIVANKPAVETNSAPAKDTTTGKPAKPETSLAQNNQAQTFATDNTPGNVTVSPGATVEKEPGIIKFNPPVTKINSETIAASNVTTEPTVPELTTGQIIASIPNIPPPVNPVKKDTVAIAPKAVAQTYASVQNNAVIEKKPAVQQAPEKAPTVQQAPAKKTMESLFAQEAMANANKKASEKQNKEKSVHFGVFAGTYMNYAEGSDNQVNVGAGFSSDFRISKNLKLSTGVSIAQNSFNYAGGSPDVPKAAMMESIVAKTFNDDRGFNPSATSSAPALNNYNARLTGLDIPVNLKYEFNPEKSDTYISAGLSSGTFINESYVYKYDYPAPFSTMDEQQSLQVDEKINNSFNGFYFARTLNLAFGVGYPLGKHNRLVIEPFVKYPLSGLGAQQIRFGAGGINLKLNFQTRK